MAIDINNGFITVRPDNVEQEFEANKRLQSNPGGLPIGDYMISQPDSRSFNVYDQQRFPNTTVWNTGLQAMAGTLNKAGGTSLTGGDLSMGSPTYFFEGDTDYTDQFQELSGLGVMSPPSEYSTGRMGLTDRGIKHQHEHGEVIPHEVAHLWDSIWGTPYNHLSTRPKESYIGLENLFQEIGISPEMIGTPEANKILSSYTEDELDAFQAKYDNALKNHYLKKSIWDQKELAYRNSKNDRERFMIDPERYNAESNETLTGYEDREYPMAAGPFGMNPNPNTDSGEWGVEPTEFEKMQQSWFRGAPLNTITKDANGNYVRNDGMYKAQYDRFMNNPNNDKLGEDKSAIGHAVATSLTDIGYDSNLFRNTMRWNPRKGVFEYEEIPKGAHRTNMMRYLNKPEERFARLTGSYFAPLSNNRYGEDEKFYDEVLNPFWKKDWKGPYADPDAKIKYKGPNFSDNAMSRKDSTLSAFANILEKNKRTGW